MAEDGTREAIGVLALLGISVLAGLLAGIVLYQHTQDVLASFFVAAALPVIIIVTKGLIDQPKPPC